MQSLELLREFHDEKKENVKKSSKFSPKHYFFWINNFSYFLFNYLFMGLYEIDETLLFVEIQTSTVRELENEIYELKNSIESLNRADAIAKRAKKI